MAYITLPTTHKEIIYFVVPGEEFDKDSIIDVPAKYCLTVWQNGEVLDAIVGPKSVHLNKKEVEGLKYGLFDRKIKCKLSLGYCEEKVILTKLDKVQYKYGKSEKMNFFTYTFGVEVDLKKGTDVVKMESEHKRRNIVEAHGVYWTDAVIKECVGIWVKGWFENQYAKDFMDVDFVIDYIGEATKDQKTLNFLLGLKKYIENNLAGFGYRVNVGFFGKKDTIQF